MKLQHIENLYRPTGQDILLFKEAFALEKIHGTAAGIVFNPADNTLTFSSGGEPHEKFVALFNREQLLERFKQLGTPAEYTVKIYGEAYGGKQQGMSHTYGPVLKFIAFDVQIGKNFLDVPKADKVVTDLGLEFVHYARVSTDLAVLDAWRDAPSMQALRNGMSIFVLGETTLIDKPWVFSKELGGVVVNPKKREGIVLRSLIELTKNNGERVICKHKAADFSETKTPRPVVDPTKMKIWEDAQAVADEWVTENRLQHVLSKIPGHDIGRMREIIAAVQEDVLREGAGEIVDSKEVRNAIGKKTAMDYKKYLQRQISGTA